MKALTLVALFVTLSAAVAGPLHPGEFMRGTIFMPDGNGQLRYVSQTEIDELGDPELFFNAEAEVIFKLYTKSNANSHQVVRLNDGGSLSASNFNAGNPTRFIIHGWNNNGDSDVNTLITNAYMQRGSFNVFVVDWGAGAQTSNYISARNRVNEVGPVVAQFIDFLVSTGGMSTSKVTVIGHSLGGHIAGITGKNVKRGRIHTIVGLDPAGPLFSTDAVNERIDKNDADYVEIIHSNGWTLGFGEPLGNADFFPNGGKSQPGCGADLTGSCAHGRSYQFFAESINNSKSFSATRCANFDEIDRNSCTSSGANMNMGGEPSNNGAGANGIYFVKTSDSSPFSLS